MNRYMIYMPVGTQGRLIPCHLDGSLTLGEMETLVDGFIDVLDSSLEPEWAREQVDGTRLIVGEDAELFGAKRNDKATWLYLNQDCDKIVGYAFLRRCGRRSDRLYQAGGKDHLRGVWH